MSVLELVGISWIDSKTGYIWAFSSIGRALLWHRRGKGFDPPKVHRVVDLSLNNVVKIELDDSADPTIETVQRIAKTLEVSVDDLLKK